METKTCTAVGKPGDPYTVNYIVCGMPCALPIDRGYWPIQKAMLESLGVKVYDHTDTSAENIAKMAELFGI